MLDCLTDWTEDLLDNAEPLGLARVAHSEAAQGFVAALSTEVIAWEQPQRGNRRAAKGIAEITRAVGAIVGGLLVNWARPAARASKRSLGKQGFTGASVGRRTYRTAHDGLIALGYVDAHEGIRFELDSKFYGKPEVLRPAQRLLDAATSASVALSDIKAHFVVVPSEGVPAIPSDLIVMRTFKERRGNQTVQHDVPLPDPLDETGAAIHHLIQQANEAAASHLVSGAMQPRWRRTFTSATREFSGDWTLGGRWIALGGADGCYQTLPPRMRRHISIDGQPACELDVSASMLTIAHGLRGLPLPEGDLYDISPDIPRNVAKAWVNTSFGLGKPRSNWAEDADEEVTGYDAKEVGRAIMQRYPWMARPEEGILPQRYAGLEEPHKALSHYLMGLEAAAITRAMKAVWKRHAGALLMPIHDGILCRWEIADDVETAMKAGYEFVCGLAPRVKRIGESAPRDF